MQLTLLGVGIRDGGRVMEGTLLSIQMLPQRGRGTLGFGLSLELGKVTPCSTCLTPDLT